MVVLTFSTTVFTTKSTMAVTMNYTTFHITNEKMFKMAKGRIRQTEELQRRRDTGQLLGTGTDNT